MKAIGLEKYYKISSLLVIILYLVFISTLLLLSFFSSFEAAVKKHTKEINSGVRVEELGKSAGGKGFRVYLCYSKRVKVILSSFEQEAIMVVLVGLLGIQDFFWVAEATPHVTDDTQF